MKRLFILLFSISLLLCAFGLRVHHLGRFSLWIDEGLTPLRASYNIGKIWANEIDIQESISKDTHPPLYYTVIHVTLGLFGKSDFALRYPSVLWGMLLIPLIYQLGRRMGGQRVGGIAALLTVINPQQLWYAQEARMYTQLVWLMAMATFCLWQAWRGKGMLWGWFIGYLLCAGAGFYTHYTAAFLILGQSVWWLVLLWRRGFQWLIGLGAVAAVLVALPYASFILARLQGPAETSYYYVPPSVMFADVVRGFGFGRTTDFATSLTFYLVIGATIVLIIGLIKANNRLFLATYLLSAVFGLMAGSIIFKPMYLGAHHIMVGSPAFLLLLAMATKPIKRIPWQWLWTLPVVIGAGFAINNLYNDPYYAKEDHRSLVQYIEERAGKNDLVLYHNAILLPLHWHYQTRADLAATARPTYPYLADATTADDVQKLVTQYDRIWFVPDTPKDLRDEGNIVPKALNEVAMPIDHRSFHGRFGVVNVVGHQAKVGQLGEIRPIATPDPALEGMSYLQTGDENRTFWLTLYWNRAHLQAANRLIELELRDESGHVWLRGVDQLLYAIPDTPTIRRSYALELPIGTPSKKMTIWLANWDEVTQRTSGEWRQLGEVAIEPSFGTLANSSDPIEWENGIELVAIELAAPTTYAGNALPATLYWRASQPLIGEWQYELIASGKNGEVAREKGVVGGEGVTAWPIGSLIAQPIGFYPAPTASSGRYNLEWRLFQGDRSLPAQTFGRFSVAEWPLEKTIPDGITEVAPNDFGGQIRLRGYRWEGTQLTLYWETLTPPTESFDIFVHIATQADQPPVAQSNGVPAGNLRPTQGWRKGEIITDLRTLDRSTLPAGSYGVYVGFYRPNDFTRLPVTADQQRLPHDQLPLTTFEQR